MKQLRIILLLLISFHLEGQIDSVSQVIEDRLENLGESVSEDEDYSQLTEILEFLSKNKLDLNYAKADELGETGLFNDLQIYSLLRHREENGQLITIYELQSIDGFDLEFIRTILPFVTVKDRFDQPQFRFSEILKYGKNEITMRVQRVLEDQKGFLDTGKSAYLGSPEKIYARYRFTYGNRLSFGVTAEKDAGEEFFSGNAKNGFDFYSGHFYVKPGRFVNTVVAGDYHAAFGQGLVMWTGFGVGKSPDPLHIKKSGYGLKPFTSAAETGFLRGGAVTLKHKQFEFTALASSRRIDESAAQIDSTGYVLELGSLQESGLHTTISEVASKNRTSQSLAAANFQFRNRVIRLGLTGSHTQLGTPLASKSELYNRFDFAGDKLFNAGINYSAIIRNINVFGEAAISGNGSMAIVNGLLISADPRCSFSILHRYYEKDYFSFYSAGFGENIGNTNEQGVFLGISFKPANTLTINSYYDNFNFPWLKYQVNAPSRGNELFTQITWNPAKKIEAYFRYREKTRAKNYNMEDRIDPIAPTGYHQFRANVSYPALPFLFMKNRIEYVRVDEKDQPAEDGFLVSHDIVFKKPGKKLSLAFRYAVFSTDSYDSRIYFFENDIPGVFSIPAVYDKGIRTYLMLSYDIMRGVEAWVRISRTAYSEKDVISEGSPTQIDSSHKTELKAQVRFSF